MIASTSPGLLVTAQDPRTSAHASERGDAELLRRYAATHDPALCERIVERFLPLARYAARRYGRGGAEPFEDLLQVACVGLLKAVHRYDPARGHAFASYALPTMLGEIRRHLRDRCWTVRPPRDLLERALVVDAVSEDLTTTLGRAPTIAEIAGELGLGDEAVLEARAAASARRGVSLSAPASGSDADAEERTLADGLGTDDDGFSLAEHRTLYEQLSAVLTARERTVVTLRFEHDLTQQEIGDRIGVSQMQVSRILRGALEKLHREAGAA
ncbi:MAG: sigma-70 family RNA polymerase sigma factor [Solirubrobacterales bacterium]|nr:sigma-70 family RNA polymerase sigma factor [Solirubrobacterales bacterium]